MAKRRMSLMARRKLLQKVVFAVLAGVLTLGLLGSSIIWTVNRNNILSNSQAEQENSMPTSEELAQKAKENPADVGVLKDLAEAYKRENMPEMAVQTYEKAVSLAPGNEDLKTGLAGSYVASGQYDQAVSLLEGIISKDPNNKQAHYDYGYALVGKKDYGKAISELEQYVNLAGKTDPDVANVKSLIEVLKPMAQK